MYVCVQRKFNLNQGYITEPQLFLVNMDSSSEDSFDLFHLF